MAEKMSRSGVVRVYEVEGPRGGKWWVMDLDCGHGKMMKAKFPPTETPCISCFLEKRSGWDCTGCGYHGTGIDPPKKYLYVCADCADKPEFKKL